MTVCMSVRVCERESERKREREKERERKREQEKERVRERDVAIFCMIAPHLLPLPFRFSFFTIFY